MYAACARSSRASPTTVRAPLAPTHDACAPRARGPLATCSAAPPPVCIPGARHAPSATASRTAPVGRPARTPYPAPQDGRRPAIWRQAPRSPRYRRSEVLGPAPRAEHPNLRTPPRQAPGPSPVGKTSALRPRGCSAWLRERAWMVACHAIEAPDRGQTADRSLPAGAGTADGFTGLAAERGRSTASQATTSRAGPNSGDGFATLERGQAAESATKRPSASARASTPGRKKVPT